MKEKTDLYKAFDDFAAAIKESGEYKAFAASQKALGDDKKQTVAEYEKLLIAGNGEEDEYKTAELYRRISIDEQSMAYLAAKNALVCMLDGLYKKLETEISFDMDFFNDL